VSRWEFDRIVLAHGRFIEHDARAVFDDVTGRLLRKVRRRGPIRRAGCDLLARIENLLTR
jgi:hypothetical protein